MGFPKNVAACLVLLAFGCPGHALAVDGDPGPDPRATIDDKAWEALSHRVGAQRPMAGMPHDTQDREVAEELSLLRMARQRSAQPPGPGTVATQAVGKAVQDVAGSRPGPGEARDVPGSGLEVMVGRAVAGDGPRPGDTCSLQRGGSVEVLGEDREMGVLVRYASPGRPQKAEGSPCISGTMAFVEAAALREWPPKGNIEAQDAAMSERVARAADRILATPR